MVETWSKNMKAHGVPSKNRTTNSRFPTRPEPYTFSIDLTYDQEIEIVKKAIELDSPIEGLRAWIKLYYPEEAEKHYKYHDWDLCFGRSFRKTISRWVQTYKDIGFHRLNKSYKCGKQPSKSITNTTMEQEMDEDVSIKIENIDDNSTMITDGRLKCNQCNYDCAANDELILNLHMEEAHGERTVQCEECKRLFSTADELQKHHIISSHWPRKFECAHCDKCFITSGRLRKHAVKMHVVCHACKLTFGVRLFTITSML